MRQYAGDYDVSGVELNARMISIAKRNLTRAGLQADLKQGSVEALPYEDEEFDTVLNTMAFSAYPRGDPALSEMKRVLKPSGRLVMIDINFPADRNRVGMALTRLWQRAGDIIRDMGALFTKHGWKFEEKEIGGFGSVHLYVCRKIRSGS